MKTHGRLLRYFISGIVTILPFVGTIGIVIWLANFFLSYLGPNTLFGKMLNNIGIRFQYQGTMAYLAGWAIILLLIFFIGFLVNNIAVKYTSGLFDYVVKKFLSVLNITLSPDTSIVTALLRYCDVFIKKIPVVGLIYKTIQQLADLMQSNKESDLNNMSPVYCRFGSMPGTLCLALLPTNDDYVIEGVTYKLVMIPTAPVPVGGGLFFIPSENVFPAPVNISELVTFYASMGVTRNTINQNLSPTVPHDKAAILPQESAKE